MSDRRLRAERKGRWGETLAAWYLRLTGWSILGRRVKTRRGEVDLIARKGRTICFIEVKWRRSAQALDTAIDTYRLRRVVDASLFLAGRYARGGEEIRIDVVLLAPGRWPKRIVNVWQPGA